MAQTVTPDPRGGRVVLGVAVDYFDSPNVPTIHFRFSPQADRSAGIGVKVDDRPEIRLAIAACNVQRCEANGRLTDRVEHMFRAGRVAQVVYLGPDGKQVLTPVSLRGFSAALDELRRLNGG